MSAQRILDERKEKPLNNRNNPFTPVYLFSGLIFCGNCGARYFVKGNYSGKGENKRYYPYYTCYSRGKTDKKYIIDHTCKNKSIATVKLDSAIIEQIKLLSFDPKAVSDLIEQSHNQERDIKLEHDIKLQLKAYNDQISRLIELCKLGSLPVQSIAVEIEEIQSKADKAQKQLDTLNAENKARLVDDDVIKERFLTAGEILENGTFEEKRALVKCLINKIIIQKDGTIEICWAFDI